MDFSEKFSFVLQDEVQGEVLLATLHETFTDIGVQVLLWSYVSNIILHVVLWAKYLFFLLCVWD